MKRRIDDVGTVKERGKQREHRDKDKGREGWKG